jgi:drug/metabolite transporter (DMT)-like permease
MVLDKNMAGYLLAGAGAALFSTKAIFIKLAYQDLKDPVLMPSLRMAIALPFFIAAGLYAWRVGKSTPSRKTLAAALGTGFIGYYLSAMLDFQGLAYISAQLERLLLFTYPIIVMFLGALWFGQRLTREGLIAAGVTYAGLALVFGIDFPQGGHDTVIGTVLVLGAALTFAIYQLIAKHYITLMGSALFTAVSLSASAVICILHRIVASGFDFAAPKRFYVLSAATALFATVFPSFLINAGMARIGAQATAMISTVSPLVTISLAVMILGEPFTLVNAAGSALVLAGVGLYTWSDMRRPVQAANKEETASHISS